MVDELAVPGAEVAEKGPEFERAIGEPAGVRNRPTLAAPEVADEDTLIERKDLGPATSTFVAAGSPIPASWRTFPAGQPAGHLASGRPWAGGTGGSGPGSPTVTR
jgi:hypothetical protein